MLGGKRGQSALEFVMTYGWALVVLLVAIGSLTFYFGFDSNAFASEACFLGPGLSCDDFVVYEDSISMKVRNSLGKNLGSFAVTSTNCNVGSDPIPIENGKEETVYLYDCGFVADDLIDESLDVAYSFSSSGIDHIKDASLTAVVASGTAQGFGGTGGGYGSDGATLSLFKFDESTGNLVSDSSTNKRHGSLTALGQMLTNPGAEIGFTTGWEGFTGVSTNSPKSGVYTFYATGDKKVFSSDAFEIDSNKDYFLEGYFRSASHSYQGNLYYGFEPYDENMVPIESYEVNVIPNTETTLYEAVSSADTMIKVIDASTWIHMDPERIAFDIDDSGSYSDLPNRNIAGGKNGKLGGKRDMGTHWEIDLLVSVNLDYPAGTKVREHRAGSTYMYTASAGPPLGTIPNSWTYKSGTVSGEAIYGIPSDQWWHGTKFAKVVGLLNLGQTNSYTLWADDLSLTSNPRTYDQEWVAGKYGNALEFNGVDEYVDVGYSYPEVTDKLTIEAWIYPTKFNSGPPTQIIGEISSQWGIYISSSNIAFFTDTTMAGGGWVSTSAPLSLNQWYHVAGVYDGAQMRLYLDGALVDSNPQSGILDTGSDFFIGADVGTSQFFNGKIDELRISDYVRYT